MPASSRTHSPASRTGVAVPAAALVALVTILPIVVVGVRGLSIGFGAAAEYLVRPRVLELLGNTGALVAITVPAALVVGVTAAWLVERTSLPFAGVWRMLLLAPLAVPAFVSAYAWISVRPGFTGLWAAALVTTLAYYPFVFLPVAAMLRALDGADEDVARSLGLSRGRAVVRTVLPRLRPAICGGALLVALHLLAEFGVLEMMRFQTFTTAILQQYAVGYSDAQGSLLALVLAVLCVGVLLLEVLARGRRRVARVGSGTAQAPARVPLGRWTVPALLALAAVVALALVVPVALVARWVWAGIDDSVVDAGRLARVTLSSLGLAAAGGLAAVLAALPGAWLLSRRRGAAPMVLERVTFIASALPGVVVALALITLSIRWARPTYQTVGLLLLAYVILFLPRAMVSLRAGLAAAPPELSEASRSLGQGGAATFWRVVLPLALPSFLTGFVLVALAIVTELTATLLLAPTGTDTLALAFWASSDELDYAAAAPYAAMMIVLSAPLTLVLRQQIRTSGRA
ncbi:iron(III) transport system permease protein [Barrientosiimonas humi]|uniref:Iron(III) transport system permease protein n=1 Tax=Barrientosiimonas humi TaxID=999931 RepID=A0A542XF48_9MICO|nr:ABC transporter permease subunit [Barrientosiimonas humi]TQL34449.1 iron(III) transport system permease protein [Barrientosiimonas humi]CAG7574438.1 Sulfate transport system permease protein CysW [Barrientosiimonas humi]